MYIKCPLTFQLMYIVTILFEVCCHDTFLRFAVTITFDVHYDEHQITTLLLFSNVGVHTHRGEQDAG